MTSGKVLNHEMYWDKVQIARILQITANRTEKYKKLKRPSKHISQALKNILACKKKKKKKIKHEQISIIYMHLVS